MKSSKAAKLAPLTGILAVAFFVAAVALSGGTPDSNEGGAKVLEYYVEHKTDLNISAFMFFYGSLFLIIFAAALRSAFRRADGDSDGPSSLAFGGGLVMAIGILMLAGVQLALADKPAALDPAAAQAINALGAGIWMTFIVGQAALMLGSGVAILRGGALPSWLGWVALVLGVLSATPVGWIAFVLVLVWVLVVAILLARRPTATATSAPGIPAV